MRLYIRLFLSNWINIAFYYPFFILISGITFAIDFLNGEHPYSGGVFDAFGAGLVGGVLGYLYFTAFILGYLLIASLFDMLLVVFGRRASRPVLLAQWFVSSVILLDIALTDGRMKWLLFVGGAVVSLLISQMVVRQKRVARWLAGNEQVAP